MEGGELHYDPRLLTFEFLCNVTGQHIQRYVFRQLQESYFKEDGGDSSRGPNQNTLKGGLGRNALQRVSLLYKVGASLQCRLFRCWKTCEMSIGVQYNFIQLAPSLQLLTQTLSLCGVTRP